MPAYEVEHICALSPAQRDALAESITHIHCILFSAPALFVNVRFTNIADHHTYVAGKRRSSNRIMAIVRHGPSRTAAHYTKLCAQLNESWSEIVGTKGEQELRAVFVLGSIVSGWEVGFMIPDAGKDKEWMVENMSAFEKKAGEGDGDFVDMLEELKTRDEFKGLVPS